MIVLDTNVVSEPMKPQPDQTVLRWLAEVSKTDDIRMTSITVAELLNGVDQLAQGKRRGQLNRLVESSIAQFGPAMVLDFDVTAARHFAQAARGRRAHGLHVEHSDTQIAAICLANNATLATRNLPHFHHTGVSLLNPWSV